MVQAAPSPPGPVFLSYSRADRDAAVAARIALERAGLEVFQDVDSIHLGEDWLARLQDALQGCSAFVVLVGQDGVRRWVGAEVQVAINRRFSAREGAAPLPIHPVLLRGTAAELLPPFLALFQATPWSPAEALPDALIDALRRQTVTGSGRMRFDGCPFVGLHAYQARDAHLFFGRGQETLDALAGLGAQQAVHPEHSRGAGLATYHRWLQIEGASGSGKSSLVGAGMLPMIERGALWARTGLDRWRVLGPILPGADPLEKLAEVLERALVPAVAERHSLARLQRLEQDERALALALRDARPDDGAFLLVVDQFEELFTLSAPERRLRFDAQLARALEDADCPLYLVSTIRSDFLDRFELLPRLQALANRACKRYLLPLISEEGLREVIERPAQLAGLDVREVTGAILDDARDEVGALPLVENALFVLWTVREGHRLTAAAYRRLDGIAGMLSAQADELLERIERQLPGGRLAALELLLRLTRIGAEGRHTRQRITRREAVLVAGDGDDALGERVVRLLSGEAPAGGAGPGRQGALRLVSTFGAPRHGADDPAFEDEDAAGPSVDLIHETLIRSRSAPGRPGQRVPYWPTLFEYIEKNRDRDLDRQQLRMLAEAWAGRRGLGRWRDLPAWSDLRRLRRLRLPAQGLEGRFLRQGLRVARLRLAAWALLAAVAAVAGESLLWSRQPQELSQIAQWEQLQRWPLVYALHRPLWMLGFVPQPELVRIDGGSFRMGCVAGRDDADAPCWADEVHPDARVLVAGPLWMGRGPVTYRQYDAYVFERRRHDDDDAPAYPPDRSGERDHRPVVGVDWHGARAYARWLGGRIGQDCRLPSEAEWEFVARAGAGATGAATLPAAVAEWVEDAHAPYRSGPPTVAAAADDAARVVRGLAPFAGSPGSRVASRQHLMPDEQAGAVGFRVVCSGPGAAGPPT